MESLRSFMLVASVRDFCAESDFIFSPADVEQNPATSEIVVEQGFLMMFKHPEDRETALPIVKSSGSVREYQPFDYHPAEPEPEPQAPAQAAQPEPKPAPAAAAAQPAAPAGGQQHPKETLISVNLDRKSVG